MRVQHLFWLGLWLAAPLARADNPYGLMLPANGQDPALTAARVAGMGVAWYRPATLSVEHWRSAAPCPACRAFTRTGLSLVLTLTNSGHGLPRHPSTPPADLAAYEARVGAILDQWKPAMLVVEDEENDKAHFADGRIEGVWDGGGHTAQLYAQELQSACSVAHARHVACSNGGLSFPATAGLTWVTLFEDGKAAQACDYARRVLPARSAELCAILKPAALPAELRAELLQNADQLLPVYRDSAIDAVNFHWYGWDAVALAQSIDVLGRLTGKPMMSNEIGERPSDPDPRQVRPLLRAAIAGGLKLAVWKSIDGPDSLSLFDPEGRLRDSGREFAHQMSGLK